MDILEEFEILLYTKYTELKQAILEKYAITLKSVMHDLCNTQLITGNSATLNWRTSRDPNSLIASPHLALIHRRS